MAFRKQSYYCGTILIAVKITALETQSQKSLARESCQCDGKTDSFV